MTFVNGEFDPSDSYRAAVVINSSDPTIRNIRVTESNPRGMYFQNSNSFIQNVEVDNNILSKETTTGIGGIYISESPLHLDSVFIHDNQGGSGGGIVTDFQSWPISYPQLKI